MTILIILGSIALIVTALLHANLRDAVQQAREMEAWRDAIEAANAHLVAENRRLKQDNQRLAVLNYQLAVDLEEMAVWPSDWASAIAGVSDEAEPRCPSDN